MMKRVIILFISVLNTIAIYSQTWVGDISSDWNDPQNWSGNTLPDDGDDIEIDPSNYINAPVMSSNSAFEPDDLTISNGGSFTITGGNITIQDDIFVNNATFTISGGLLDVDEITGNNNANVNLIGGTVTMSNDLDANSGSTFTIATTVTQTTNGEDLNIGTDATFIIQDGANISGFDDVDFDSDGGTLTMTGGTLNIDDDFKFQDGDDNTVNVSGGNLIVGDDFEIETDNNQITFNGTANVDVGGDFEFGANGGGTDNDATNSTVNVGDNATLDVLGDINFYEGGSGSNSFLNVGDSGSVTTNNVDDLDSVNISDGGTVNNGGTVLPVELLFFKGKIENDNVLLSWNTASELNNDYFEILHSTNGSNFSLLAKIGGAGTTSSLTKYSFKDYPLSGVNYYLLRQVDFNGASEEFNIVRVESELSQKLTIYPNPVSSNEELTIQFNNAIPLKTTVKIISMDGREVYRKTMNNPGYHFKINSLGLKKGNYLVILQGETHSITKKISVK